jgi:hypothetical protein
MTHHEEAESAARAIRAREDRIREHLALHRAAWGDGPPYFSEASFAFWQAIKAGRFCLARCGACAHVYFPPRVVCPACWAEDQAQLADTPGHGTLMSYTDVHVVADVLRPLRPLRIAVLDLDEGVRLLTWLRETGTQEVLIGTRCRISVEPIEGIPRFVAHPMKETTP